MIEYRFTVVDAHDISYKLKSELVVIRITGDRKRKIVATSWSKATHYRSRHTHAEWDAMPRTPQDAVDEYQASVRNGIAARESQIAGLYKKLVEAQALPLDLVCAVELNHRSDAIPPVVIYE